MTLYNIDQLGLVHPVILDGNEICNSTTSPSCYNLTSLDSSTVVFNVSSMGNFSVGNHPGYTLTDCTNITEPGVYDIGNNISSSDEYCIVVNSDDVTIDGNGFNLSCAASSSKGIYVNFSASTTIENMTLKDCDTNLYLNSVSRNIINNISLLGARNNIIMTNSSSSNITDAVINDSLSVVDLYGMRILDSSSILLSDIFIGPMGTGIGNELLLSNVNNSRIQDIEIDCAAFSCVSLFGTYNIIFDDSIVDGIMSVQNSNNINMTNLTTPNSISSSGSSNIRKNWYIDVYVQDNSSMALPSATVSAYNTTSSNVFSTTTSGTGYISQRNVSEYVIINDIKIYSNNYTINASRTSYNSSFAILNITDNVMASLTLRPQYLNINSVSHVPTNTSPEDEINITVDVSNTDGIIICNITGDLGNFSNSSSSGTNQQIIYHVATQPIGMYDYDVTCIDDMNQDSDTSNALTVNYVPNIFPVNLSSSVGNPLLGQPVLLTAKINTSYGFVEDLTVAFYDGTTNIGNKTITYIGPNSQQETSLTHIFTSEENHVITVEVNPNGQKLETNYSDNNYSIVLPVGTTSLGDIFVEFTASPNPVDLMSTFDVSGRATYDFSPYLAVAGGIIVVTLEGSDTSYYTYTDSNGMFSVNDILADSGAGDFELNVTSSDGSISGINFTIMTIEEDLFEFPDLWLKDIYYNDSTIIIGDDVIIYARVRNIGGNSTNNSVYFYENDVLIGNASFENLFGYGNESIVSINHTFLNPGTRSIKASVDPLNNLTELLETNNNRTESLNVYDMVVDLQPYSLSVDNTTPLSNGSFSITAYVRNNGGNSTENVTVDFYANDTYLGESIIPFIGSAGQSTTILATNLSSAGTYDIKLVVNGMQNITEASYDDNNYTRSSYVTVYDSYLPDFVITDISAQQLFVQATSTITIDVLNNGLESATSTVLLEVYIDDVLQDSNYVGPISQGQTYEYQFDHYFDRYDFGTQSIYASVNSDANVSEINYANDNRTESFTIYMPDLYIVSTDISYNITEAEVGDDVNISLTIHNPDSGVDNVTVNLNKTIGNESEILSQLLVNLSSGDNIVSTLWNNIPSTGSYVIAASVNPYEKQYENNSNNNIATKSLLVYNRIDIGSCGTLNESNTEYVLNTSISGIIGSCFNITASNVTLMGNGYNITGSSGIGIYVNTGTVNVTVRDFAGIITFPYAVYLDGTLNSTVSNITTDTSDNGVTLYNSSNTDIIGNTIRSGTSDGITIIDSDNTTIESNSVYDFFFTSGVHLVGTSDNATLLNNNIYNNIGGSIEDESSGYHNLLYNNSYGQIEWVDNSFLASMDVAAALTFPGHIRIDRNSAYVNASNYISENIDSEINITLDLSGLSISSPYILKDGANCTNECSILSYSNNIIVFNATSLGEYTVSDEEISIGNWTRIISPQGIFEPYNSSLYGTHVNTFQIHFENLSISNADLVCDLKISNGSVITLRNNSLNIFGSNYSMNYTMTSSDSIVNNTGAHYIPWILKNCSIVDGINIIHNETLNDRIYVHHGREWDESEVTRAVSCMSAAGQYFNNTATCTFNEDVNFALKMEAGAPVNESCYNSLDNSTNDPYCRGIFFPLYDPLDYHVGYSAAVDDPNGYAEFSVSVGGYSTDVSYTSYPDASNNMKIRFVESLTGQPFSFAIRNLTNASSVSAYGEELGDGSVQLEQFANNTQNILYTNFDGFSGDLDFTLNISFNDSKDEDRVFAIIISYGTSTNADSPATFIVSFNSTHGFDSNDEGFNTTLAYDINSSEALICGDGANNDFDYLGNSGIWDYSYDCFDEDCNGSQGSVTQSNEFGSSLSGICSYGTEAGYCNDSYDNDYDYLLGIDFTDCHDADCFQNDAECLIVEAICNDSVNDDWDYTLGESDLTSSQKIGNNGTKYDGTYIYDLTDCEDPDCDGRVGGPSGQSCDYGYETSCADGFDNDALQLKDCELSVLSGSTDMPTPADAEYDCKEFCRIINSTETGIRCDNNLDDDYDAIIITGYYSDQYSANNGIGNYGTDCRWGGYFGIGTNYNPDEDCNMTTMSSGAVCELAIELSCDDGYDNDFDHDASGMYNAGWTEEAYELYFNSSYSEDADYDDYDCADGANVPSSEALNASWCFDGVDNDLDAYYFNGSGYSINSSSGYDCSDPDCLGISNPNNANQTCLDYEYNNSDPFFDTIEYPGLYCANGLNDDADEDGYDCSDPDCYQQFSICSRGPCYTTENTTWYSCSDGTDNDYDGDMNCLDPDCDGMVGSTSGSTTGALCEHAIETSCFDGFDNDGDGDIDCADSDCDAYDHPLTGLDCEFLFESDCDDGFDNDRDGSYDCSDSDCYATCGVSAVSGLNPITLPTTQSSSLTGGVSAYISSYTSRVRMGEWYNITMRTTSASTNALWIIGSSDNVFPKSQFDVSGAYLSGPNAADFTLTEEDIGFVIESNGANLPSGYTVSLLLQSIGTLTPYSYEISHSEENGGDISNGNTLSIEIVENNTPSIDIIRVDPNATGMNYGGSVYIIADAMDDYSMGACQWSVTGADMIALSDSTDCKTSFSPTIEGTYVINVTPVDYYSNVGESVVVNYDLNIVPIGSRIDTDKTFYAPSDLLDVNASFSVASSDNLDSCELIAQTEGFGSSNVSIANISASSGSCNFTDVSLSGLPDGMYNIIVLVSESTEDDYVYSYQTPIYICSAAEGECSFVDFGGDEYPDICDEVSQDLIAPTVTITSPYSDYHTGSIILDMAVSDSNLQATYYNITNSSGSVVFQNSTFDSGPSFEWNDVIDISSLDDGNYTISVYANDSIGKSKSDSIWFIVDNTYPQIDWDSFSVADAASVPQDFIVSNVTWNESYFSFIYWNISNVAESNYTTATYGHNETNGSGLAYGLYYYNVTICDMVDHCNTTTTRSITLYDGSEEAAQCQDGIDNDGDGAIDYGILPGNDPGCSSGTDDDESDGYVTCTQDSDCGTTIVDYYCSGSSSYTHYTNTTTFTCNNAGHDTSYCSNSSVVMGGPCDYICSNSSLGCDYTECSDGIDNDNDTTFDYSTGSDGDSGCANYYDDNESDGVVACSSDSECGEVFIVNFCLDYEYYTNSVTPVCILAGYDSSYCYNSTISTSVECSYTCSNSLGCDVIDEDATCSEDADCGNQTSISWCDGLTYNMNTTTPTCLSPGTSDASCSDILTNVNSTECSNICSGAYGCDYSACSDGIDNDGDGFIDYGTGNESDDGCVSFEDSSESSEDDSIVDAPGDNSGYLRIEHNGGKYYVFRDDTAVDKVPLESISENDVSSDGNGGATDVTDTKSKVNRFIFKIDSQEVDIIDTADYTAEEIGLIDIEVNLNKEKHTKYVDFIDDLEQTRVDDDYVVEIGSDVPREGSYEAVAKIYYKGMLIDEKVINVER
ncbi:hypothetical protein H6503_02420 [Candidatus Woesearchaeota archaeon]|nr:hypothetical protein [Candidatus Woesearchaeota archaeon]